VLKTLANFLHLFLLYSTMKTTKLTAIIHITNGFIQTTYKHLNIHSIIIIIIAHKLRENFVRLSLITTVLL